MVGVFGITNNVFFRVIICMNSKDLQTIQSSKTARLRSNIKNNSYILKKGQDEMKKILTAAIAVIVAALALTGCSDNSNSNNSSDNQSSNTSSSNTSDNSTSSVESNSSEDSTSSDESSSSEESSTDSGEESEPIIAETLEFPDTKAGRMVKAALEFNPDEWSMAMTLADDEMLSVSLPDLNADMFEEYCFAFDMIGINGHTVFVGKAKAGQEEAVKSTIENSLETYKQNVSFYPAGQEAAEGAVNGTTDDGYNYFVIHADGENIASAMLAAN